MAARMAVPTLLHEAHARGGVPSIAGGTALQCICT